MTGANSRLDSVPVTLIRTCCNALRLAALADAGLRLSTATLAAYKSFTNTAEAGVQYISIKNVTANKRPVLRIGQCNFR